VLFSRCSEADEDDQTVTSRVGLDRQVKPIIGEPPSAGGFFDPPDHDLVRPGEGRQ